MKTTTQKNPLRQLASAIVLACQQDGAKGIKQSTVLNTLSKAQGLRSIQCGDNPTSARPDAAALSRQIFLQTLLFSAYPNSDLLPVEVEDLVGRTLNAQDQEQIGDRMLVALWNSLTAHPRHFVPLLNTLSDDFKRIEGALDNQAGQVYTFALSNPFLRDFINAELRECADGLTGEERHHCQLDVLDKLARDLDAIHDAFEANALAWSWSACGLNSDADAPDCPKIMAAITPEAEQVFTV